MNSQDEQHINIKFYVCVRKWTTGMIKLLKRAYGCKGMAETTIHKWHSTFPKTLNEAALHEKKKWSTTNNNHRNEH